MNVEKKKKLLKEIVLNSKYSYDMLVYRLLSKNVLDDIITKIDNVPVECNIDSSEWISADEQFIQLLDRFICYFRNTFFTICSSEYIIEMIINTNKDRIREYLLSKHYLGDNNYIDFFNESIYKIFISNFVQNSSYIPLINNLFIKEKLEIKNINDYNLNEILKIVTLISDLLLCSNGKNSVIYIFYNIDYESNQYIEKNKSKKKNKNNRKEYKIKLIEHYTYQYELIIKNYIQKKKYLKYFK